MWWLDRLQRRLDIRLDLLGRTNGNTCFHCDYVLFILMCVVFYMEGLMYGFETDWSKFTASSAGGPANKSLGVVLRSWAGEGAPKPRRHFVFLFFFLHCFLSRESE